jgi:Integrase core domain
LNQLGITHRRTAYNHPEGNSYIERFHRSLKEEEVWLNEYESFDQAELNIARWIEEYNHDRPHHGLQGRTPHESRAQFLAQTLQTWPLVSSLEGCTTGDTLHIQHQPLSAVKSPNKRQPYRCQVCAADRILALLSRSSLPCTD